MATELNTLQILALQLQEATENEDQVSYSFKNRLVSTVNEMF